jgi:uncharacterized MAPEG superfamily protein
MTKFLEADASTDEGLKIIMAGFAKAAVTVVVPAILFVIVAQWLQLFQTDWVQSRTDNLIYVGQNLAFAGLVLTGHIFWVSITRTTPSAEKWQEGHRPSPGTTLDMAQRIALNTLEQTVIFALAQLALASVLPPESIDATRALLVVWIAGRLMYVVGYRKHPFYRSYGFNATILPSLFALLYAAFRIVFG